MISPSHSLLPSPHLTSLHNCLLLESHSLLSKIVVSFIHQKRFVYFTNSLPRETSSEFSVSPTFSLVSTIGHGAVRQGRRHQVFCCPPTPLTFLRHSTLHFCYSSRSPTVRNSRNCIPVKLTGPIKASQPELECNQSEIPSETEEVSSLSRRDLRFVNSISPA